MATTLTIPRLESVAAPRSEIGRRVLYWLPLALILLAQFALTVRLIPQGSASHDEALYIEAGHVLIHELFHGGGTPYYETYFSGAPVAYSPLAAMADYAGGLAAVRLLSAMFLQVAAVMLYLTGRRLFGYWPAAVSCALWAGLSLTQIVGRNAIYDALALMLLSVAGYCASRSNEARWLLLVPLALLGADTAKYVTLLFNPTVILIAAYQPRGQGVRAVLRRMTVLGGTTGALLALALFLAGSAYVKGIMFTTLARKTGASVLLGANPAPDSVILSEAWHWFGLIVVMAFAAVALASLFPRERAHAWLLLTFAVTSTLVTAEAIHLGSDESMGRHDDFAAWFGCLAAGYMLTLLVRQVPWRSTRWALAGGAAAVVGISGILYTFGPATFANHGSASNTEVQNITPIDGILAPYLNAGHFRYLLTGYYLIPYTDHVWVPWWDLDDDNYIKYPIPGRGGNWHDTARGVACTALKPGCMYLEGNAGYVAAIKAHDFAIISITRLAGLLPQDHAIEHAAATTPGYVLLTAAGGGPTWIYLPDYEHAEGKAVTSS
jgi:hypothetical protein